MMTSLVTSRTLLMVIKDPISETLTPDHLQYENKPNSGCLASSRHARTGRDDRASQIHSTVETARFYCLLYCTCSYSISCKAVIILDWTPLFDPLNANSFLNYRSAISLYCILFKASGSNWFKQVK